MAGMRILGVFGVFAAFPTPERAKRMFGAFWGALGREAGRAMTGLPGRANGPQAGNWRA